MDAASMPLQGDQIAGALEALLFVTDEPVSALKLAEMLEMDTGEVTAELEQLRMKLEEEGRGIQLREVAGGWRLYTHPAYHDLIQQYVLSWDTRRMSQAALEVLAIVAYGQPITRAQIASVRGVNSDSALATLIERGYVRETGTIEAPGSPILYGTTKTFLEKFGLASTRQLPNLEEFAPDEKTVALIRERLGAPAQGEQASILGEDDLPEPEQLVADASASIFGTVEKIDFDALVFNTDDD